MRGVALAGLAAPAAAAVLALAPGPAASPSSFGEARRIPLGAGRQPGALATGDFDRDGRLDVAVGADGTGDVTILFGDGRGGLHAGPHVPAGPHPTEIVAADFNRDGSPDLAVANHESPDLVVLLGDGRGGLRPAPGSPVRVHSVPHPHTIDACDADGDGNLDLIVDSWGENRLTLVRGDGRGGFAGPGEPIDVGRKPYRNLKARDLDGDGRCDVVAPSYELGVVTVLRGDGRGGFHAAPPIHAGPAPFTVDAGDLDGDGNVDLAVQNYSGQLTDPSDDALTFLLGDGKGGFRLGPRIATGSAPLAVAVGDVNGDRIADAVTADHGSSTLTVSLGGPGGLSASRTSRVPLPCRPDRLVLADLNGDRLADAIVACRDSAELVVLLARPTR
ncbi:MAG TPA: VCBS repeat-containing protein [Thermoanaerobaculia bacterium]|jgi:hypothetical protein|nr:VCBS repeat-containing protein [Thermoanaerobaculia bacterium]